MYIQLRGLQSLEPGVGCVLCIESVMSRSKHRSTQPEVDLRTRFQYHPVLQGLLLARKARIKGPRQVCAAVRVQGCLLQECSPREEWQSHSLLSFFAAISSAGNIANEVLSAARPGAGRKFI